MRERDAEVTQQLGNDLHHLYHTDILTNAAPAPGAKGEEALIHLPQLFRVGILPSLWDKFFWLFENGGIVLGYPRVDTDDRSTWDVLATNGGTFRRNMAF